MIMAGEINKSTVFPYLCSPQFHIILCLRVSGLWLDRPVQEGVCALVPDTEFEHSRPSTYIHVRLIIPVSGPLVLQVVIFAVGHLFPPGKLLVQLPIVIELVLLGI